MQTCTSTNVLLHTHKHTHAQAHMLACTHTCKVRTSTYIHLYTHLHTHKHAHVHRHAQAHIMLKPSAIPQRSRIHDSSSSVTCSSVSPAQGKRPRTQTRPGAPVGALVAQDISSSQPSQQVRHTPIPVPTGGLSVPINCEPHEAGAPAWCFLLAPMSPRARPRVQHTLPISLWAIYLSFL